MAENLRRTRFLPSRRVMALAVGAVAVVSTASALAPPAGAAGRPVAASLPQGAVPWSKAGPGWTVAEFSANTLPPQTVKHGITLYLTGPLGGLYQIYFWPKTYAGPAYTLVDWSGDRQRVLLAAPASPGHPTRFEQISLVSRKVISHFMVPSAVSVLGYTRPSGLNLLAIRPHGSDEQVVRYDLAGKLQVVLATGKGITSAIDSPDGSAVVFGTSTGLGQVSNTGGRVKRINAPVAVTGCSPVRWWAAGTVLASCTAKGALHYPRLWLFPVTGGKVTALTPQREGHGPDFGDIAAWRLTSGRLYLQAIGVCGSLEFIGWQWRNGTLHPVTVPGTANDNRILAGFGRRLLVWATLGCGGRRALLSFDPATGAVRWLLRPYNWAGVVGVVPFGRPTTG